MLIAIPYILMIITLGVCLLRWGKIIYYIMNGYEIEARVSKHIKTKFNVPNSTNMPVSYYHVGYLYNREGQNYEGKLAKLYRKREYNNGDSIKIRVLKSNPCKSIGISLKESFTYEHICFLAFIMLFIFLVII